MPRVSALIVSYNTRDLLLDALTSIVSPSESEIIVVDNASGDGSADAVAEHFTSVRLIRSASNAGFAAGINRAAACATGEMLLLLNPDARLQAGALESLVSLMDRSARAGLVAPSLRYADGSHQPAAFLFPGLTQLVLDLFPIPRLSNSRLNGRVSTHQAVRIDHPLGACMLIRRSAWEDVGPLDEGYFMYLEEVDWCRRARLRGWEIWSEPSAVVVHHGGESTRQQADAMFAQLWRSRLRYYQRFGGPAFNRLVRAIVKVGLTRAARGASPARRQAIDTVRRLVD